MTVGTVLIEIVRKPANKHIPQRLLFKARLVYEYLCDSGDPYYPIPRQENAAVYKKYEALAARTRLVHFSGRLATYKYYNMDQVVAQALTLCAKLPGETRAVLVRKPKTMPSGIRAAITPEAS